MEARRIIKGELSTIGIHGLSNNGFAHPSISSRQVPPPVDIPLIYAIFYASERASPLSSYISRLRKNYFGALEFRYLQGEHETSPQDTQKGRLTATPARQDAPFRGQDRIE